MASERRPGRRPELTERDVLVLCDLVRFGPLRLEQLARRHGFPSERSAQLRLTRLIARGLLKEYALKSYLATPKGTRSTGLGLRPPGEPGPHLPHDMAVADLALWLLEREPGSVWVTEREMRHGIGLPPSASGHFPDGKLVSASREAAAIELELKPKPTNEYDRILRWFARALVFDRFQWYVQGPEIERVLTERAERHDLGEFMSVEQVPTVVRVLKWTG